MLNTVIILLNIQGWMGAPDRYVNVLNPGTYKHDFICKGILSVVDKLNIVR